MLLLQNGHTAAVFYSQGTGPSKGPSPSPSPGPGPGPGTGTGSGARLIRLTGVQDAN
jgi:hypothetical protein